jgi:hypothetical protein
MGTKLDRKEMPGGGRGAGFRFDLRWRGANLAIPAGMLVYAAGAGFLCRTLGHAADFRLDLYLAPFYASYALYAAIIGATLLARSALRRRDHALLCFSRTWPLDEFVERLLGALPFLLIWPIFMSGFTSIKTLLNDTLPFAWDDELLALGLKLHLGTPLWLALDSRPVTLVLEFLYAFWGVLLVAVPFSVCLRNPTCPKRTRFLVSHLLILVLMGNVAAGMFMSAGPFWLDVTARHHDMYAPLFDYLARADANGSFSAVAFQRYLWEAHQHRETWLGTGISAFPSIHVAIATLYVLFGWQFGRLARWGSILFLIAIMIGSVNLGWHYPFDGYAGIAGAVAIYAAVGWAQRRLVRAPVPPTLTVQPLAA